LKVAIDPLSIHLKVTIAHLKVAIGVKIWLNRAVKNVPKTSIKTSKEKTRYLRQKQFFSECLLARAKPWFSQYFFSFF
jgi:hypothetical protein